MISILLTRGSLTSTDELKHGMTVDISSYVGHLTISSSIDTNYTQCSCNIIWTNTWNQLPRMKYSALAGDMLTISDLEKNKVIFIGKIWTRNIGYNNEQEIVAYDYPYVLTKNTDYLNLRGKSRDIITKLIKTYSGLEVGRLDIPNIDYSQIHNGATISDIIDDILKKCSRNTGRKYNFNFNYTTNKVDIANMGTVLPYTVKLTFDDLNYGEDLNPVVNSVIVYDENSKPMITLEDKKSQGEYGLLRQAISTQDEEDMNKVAKSTIYPQPERKVKMTTFAGDYSLQPGTVINTTVPYLSNVHPRELYIESATYELDMKIKKRDVTLETSFDDIFKFRYGS